MQKSCPLPTSVYLIRISGVRRLVPAETTPPSRARRIADPLVASVAAALLTATLHQLTVWMVRDVVGDFTWSWSGRDTPWMLAIGYLLVMLPIGAVLAGVGALRREGVASRTVASVLVTTSVFSVLLLFDRIDSYAWLIVAAGVGVCAGRWAASHECTLRRLVRATAVAGTAAYLAIGLWATAGQSWRESRALAALPTSSRAVNVLLVILDTVTATDLSLYGNSRATTPTIDSLAAGAVVFEEAFSPAPWTLPAHASMFTGLWPSQHGADWKRPLDGAAPTLAEGFRSNGYATGAFTANLIATGSSSGLPRGFVTYRDTKRTFAETAQHSTLAQSIAVRRAVRSYRRTGWLRGSVRHLLTLDFRPDNQYQAHHPKAAPEVTDDFLRWQRSLDGRPFFAFLNYFDAHAPYESPLRRHFNGGRTARDQHEGALRYIDGEIARVLGALRASGALDRTIVVITADHGEQFGEHGLTGHGNSLYRPLLHVPLLIRYPDARGAGTRVQASVSTRDLAATLVSSAGVHAEDPFAGRSLEPLFLGLERGGRRALAELSRGEGAQGAQSRNARGALKAVIDDSLHVIRELATDRIEAFRYRSDRAERTNVAASATARAALRRYVDAMTHDDAAALGVPR